MFDFVKATKPTIYFIGVTTTRSSIMKVFPAWAKALGISADIVGIDLPLHAPDNEYRKVVSFIKEDPLSYGALVTTHKLDLFKACVDLFDFVDPYAALLYEVSSLSKKDGKFCAHAKDPISSGLAMEHFIPQSFWKEHKGEALLLGAGGSCLAMSVYLTQNIFHDNIPARITIANRSVPRLQSAQEKLALAAKRTEFRFIHSPALVDNDKLVAELPAYSLVVNTTGLGKDAPGSPTTDNVDFPYNSLVWEINYRGDLLFKEQAERQQEKKHLHIEDGWKYFIHGWSCVIEEVFHIDIRGDRLQELSEIAMYWQNK